MTIYQYKLACFIAIVNAKNLLRFSFWITESENVIWKTEYAKSTIYQYSNLLHKFTIQHKTIVRCVFIPKFEFI